MIQRDLDGKVIKCDKCNKNATSNIRDRYLCKDHVTRI